MPTYTYKIERLKGPAAEGGRTLALFIRPGRVRGPWKWFEPDAVPPFEGDYAWFEIERKGAAWAFVRQVTGRQRERVDAP